MNVLKSMVYMFLLTPLLIYGMEKENLPIDVQELHQIIEKQRLDIENLKEKIKTLESTIESEKQSARAKMIDELYEATLENRRQMLQRLPVE
jgi:hypothetical protein